MKQKYSIIKSKDGDSIIIKEFAELDKEIMSLLCEETYESKVIADAIKEGQEAVIDIIRTKNMYPPKYYAIKIAEQIMELFKNGDIESSDLLFDDKELIVKASQAPIPEAENEDEEMDVDSDDLLDESLTDDYKDKKLLKKVETGIKVADDSTELDDIG